jgi:hypothetical protein
MSNLFDNSPFKTSLTKTQIETLIKQEIERSCPNFTVNQISFNVTTQTDMRHEVSGTTFEGVDIVLKPSGTSKSSYWDR